MPFSFAKICFLLLYAGAAGVMVLAAIRVRESDGAIGRRVRVMLSVSVVTSLFYILGFLIPNEMAAIIFYSFFFVGLIVFLLAMFEFTLFFTGQLLEISHYWMVPVAILLMADVFMLFANGITGWMFKITAGVAVYGNNELFSVFEVNGLMYYHLGLCAATALAVVALLIVKAVAVPAMYKSRFVYVAVAASAVTAASVIGILLGSTWGFAGLYCAVNSIVSYYCSLCFQKEHLSGHLLALTARDLPSCLLAFNVDGECIYANTFAKNMFDLDENDSSEILKAYLADRLPGKRYETIAEGNMTETREYGGKRFQLESDYKRLYDQAGRFVGFFLSVSDRTKAIKQYKESDFTKTHDALTSLYNEEGFEQKVNELLSKEPDVPRVIACCDIKDFKMINENFGENAANGLLISIGRLLGKECEDTDSIPARLRADRFAICMRKERFSDTMFAEMAQAGVKLPQNKFYKVVVYVGVFDDVNPSLSVSEMCHRAFIAVDSIKGDYNKTVAHYDNNLMHEGREKEQEIVNELRAAMKAGQFKAYVQPQVNAEGLVNGGEMLARWIHPNKGMIAPASFLPIFERTGLITLLDRFVWSKACETLKGWEEKGAEGRYLSVNISPRDFYYIDVFKEFTALVNEYGINPANLKLEFAENSVMQDLPAMSEIMKKLRDFGFTLALDNFGKGNAGIEQLNEIPVQILKLDNSILKRSATDKKSRDVLNSIIKYAKKLGETVVCEGVETKAQVDMLEEFGCDLYQGFYFAKPMPLDEFEVMYFELKADGEGNLDVDGVDVDEILDKAAEITGEDSTSPDSAPMPEVDADGIAIPDLEDPAMPENA